MFGRGDFNLNYVQYYPTFTLKERMSALRTWIFTRHQISLCPVIPNPPNTTDRYAREIMHNNIYYYWTEIYSRLRDKTTFNFNMPTVGKFGNYRSVLNYANKYPDSKLAVSFDLASALAGFDEKPAQPIVLWDLTLDYWRQHPHLKNIVNCVSSNFQEKLTTQINNEVSPSPVNVITLHY